MVQIVVRGETGCGTELGIGFEVAEVKSEAEKGVVLGGTPPSSFTCIHA